MAGASLLTLLDDIATVLDDVAAMTNMAVKKTAGVLGDDLALNAEQVSGVNANRELPVARSTTTKETQCKPLIGRDPFAAHRSRVGCRSQAQASVPPSSSSMLVVRRACTDSKFRRFTTGIASPWIS